MIYEVFPSIGDSCALIFDDDDTSGLPEKITGSAYLWHTERTEEKETVSKLSHKQLGKLNSAERAEYARARSNRKL